MNQTLLLIVVLACLGTRAAAQSPLGLHQAVERALAANPAIAAAAEKVGVAEGYKTQAGLKPNPRFVVQSENLRAWESPRMSFPQGSDDYLYFSQTLERGAKRERRADVAEAGVERSRAERGLLARQIAGRVGASYWEAVGALQSRDLLAAEMATFSRVVEYNRQRVREGAVAGADLLRIELEAGRLRTLLESAGREVVRTRMALFREMGVADDASVKLGETLSAASELKVPEMEKVIASRDEMRVARSASAQAQTNVALQQANAKQDPDVILGYKRTGGYDTLVAGVQIALPVRNRNQGLIAAAMAELRSAQASERAVELQIRAEVTSAQADYESRGRMLREVLPDMREKAARSSEIAQAAYREGGVDLLRLLDAERTRLETEMLYNRALMEYQQSAVALKIAMGEMP